jgi:hypothetical protein
MLSSYQGRIMEDINKKMYMKGEILDSVGQGIN